MAINYKCTFRWKRGRLTTDFFYIIYLGNEQASSHTFYSFLNAVWVYKKIMLQYYADIDKPSLIPVILNNFLTIGLKSFCK